jgi:hypothetical protein
MWRDFDVSEDLRCFFFQSPQDFYPAVMKVDRVMDEEFYGCFGKILKKYGVIIQDGASSIRWLQALRLYRRICCLGTDTDLNRAFMVKILNRSPSTAL